VQIRLWASPALHFHLHLQLDLEEVAAVAVAAAKWISPPPPFLPWVMGRGRDQMYTAQW
jgi:hypothetical protein